MLIPIMGEDGDARILLTRRSTNVKSHKGEISFPGGMYEDADGETVRTAIRECGEEIGVGPNDIEIVGRLSDMETMTGFVITPYVGLIPYPYDFKLNPDEVRYLIYLPFPFLMSSRPQATTAEHKGRTMEVFEIVYNGERIWGATCRLLLELRRYWMRKFNFRVLLLLSSGHMVCDIYQGALPAVLPFLKQHLALTMR